MFYVPGTDLPESAEDLEAIFGGIDACLRSGAAAGDASSAKAMAALQGQSAELAASESAGGDGDSPRAAASFDEAEALCAAKLKTFALPSRCPLCLSLFWAQIDSAQVMHVITMIREMTDICAAFDRKMLEFEPVLARQDKSEGGPRPGGNQTSRRLQDAFSAKYPRRGRGVAATRPRGISTGPRLVSPAGQGKTFIKVTHTTTKQTAYLSDAEFTMVLQMLQDEKLQLVMSFESHEEYFSPRVDLPRQFAATPWLRRGRSVETGRARAGTPSRTPTIPSRCFSSIPITMPPADTSASDRRRRNRGRRSAALRGVDVVASQVPIVLF